MCDMKKSVSLLEIKAQLNAEVYSKNFEVMQDAELRDFFVTGISSLDLASDSDIGFFSGKQKHAPSLIQTKACACLIDPGAFERLEKPQVTNFVVVKDVNLSYAKLMLLFYSEPQLMKENISKSASIDPSASLGKNCEIMAGSYIGKNVKIGDNVKIYPCAFIGDGVIIGDGCIVFHAASIFHATIGRNTMIHSGARLGKDGFRYATDEMGRHIRVPHIGRVIIGDDVEIGANTTIDRGSITDTIIGDMCKLDNLVQIGHNVVLGKGCFVVAQVGIAGSVMVGDYVAIGGQAGIADHISIGSHARIAAQSGVMQDILPKEVVMGSPAQPIREYFRQVATIKNITLSQRTLGSSNKQYLAEELKKEKI